MSNAFMLLRLAIGKISTRFKIKQPTKCIKDIHAASVKA
jgi:hypothetical protein